MRLLAGGLFALVTASLISPALTVAAAGACGDLAKLALPHATITTATSVPAGGFKADAQDDHREFAALPAFCRVAATLKPSRDSDIKIEVWMPASDWNGKFQAVGNGAFSGAIAYPAMATALGRGYATSSTDTGHAGGSASFALGHPEKVIDFGWRAVHEMTVDVEEDHRGLLRRRAEVLVLERLLGRRTAGDEGSAALPGGLRRHHRRRAGSRLDRTRGAGGARREGAGERPKPARLSQPQTSAAAPRGGRRPAMRWTA